MNTDTKRLVEYIETLTEDNVVEVRQHKRTEKTWTGYGHMEHETEVTVTYGSLTFNVINPKGTLCVVIEYRIGYDNTDDAMAVLTGCKASMADNRVEIPPSLFSANYKYRLYKMVEKCRVHDEATGIVNMLGI